MSISRHINTCLRHRFPQKYYKSTAHSATPTHTHTCAHTRTGATAYHNPLATLYLPTSPQPERPSISAPPPPYPPPSTASENYEAWKQHQHQPHKSGMSSSIRTLTHSASTHDLSPPTENPTSPFSAVQANHSSLARAPSGPFATAPLQLQSQWVPSPGPHTLSTAGMVRR